MVAPMAVIAPMTMSTMVATCEEAIIGCTRNNK